MAINKEYNTDNPNNTKIAIVYGIFFPHPSSLGTKVVA
jgi:hypothetical protein